MGGKRNLAKRLTAIIDTTPHTFYGEPFVGMGGIFLRRKMQPKAEAINDFGHDVSNLFRILQRHYPQFMDVLRFQLTTRTEFYRLTKVDPTTLTDLERAARFLYLQRTAFGGKVSGRNFGVAGERPARFNLTTLEPMLQDLHERLASVVIECLDYAKFITRYDRNAALFYLDPPYWGTEGCYGKELFSRAEYAKMAALLAGLKGKFILSINDVPEIRDLFAAFKIQAIKTSYTLGKTNAAKGTAPELLISNFAFKKPG